MVSFAKKLQGNSKPAETAKQEPEEKPTSKLFGSSKSGASTSSGASSKPQNKPASSGGSSFLKTGKAAKQAMAEAEAKAEAAQAEKGKLFRYRMPQKSDRKITFLDGGLDDENMLDVPMYYEHNVQVAGEWQQYVCTRDENTGCPICDKGDKPSLVGLLTVIDHTPHIIKNGPNAGKKIENSKKLFVAKRNSLKMLSKLAVKQGGLTGTTWEVSRGGDKDPAIGNVFQLDEKFSDMAAFAKKYGLKPEDVQPADYEAEITHRTPEELIALGVGKASTGVGYESSDLGNEL